MSGPISQPCRVVHMLSAQPQPTTRSAPAISSAASGGAKLPLTSSPWAAEQAARHGGGREQRAAALGQLGTEWSPAELSGPFIRLNVSNEDPNRFTEASEVLGNALRSWP